MVKSSKFQMVSCTMNILAAYKGMSGSRWGGQGSGPLAENHKNIGFLSNTDTDPLKNHKKKERW